MCNVTTGYDNLSICRNYQTGVEKFDIRKWSGATVWSVDSNNIQTGCTASDSGSPFYEITQKFQMGEFIPGEGVHDVTGVAPAAFTNRVIMHMMKWQNSLRNFTYTMAQFEVEIIATLNNGELWTVGTENGANISASAPTVGKTINEFAGSIITFESTESQPAYNLSSTLYSTFTII
jgi:hypothetical protein